jgi:hypothetical protein
MLLRKGNGRHGRRPLMCLRVQLDKQARGREHDPRGERGHARKQQDVI